MFTKKALPTPPKPTSNLSFSSTNFDEVAFINQLLPETNTKNFATSYKDVKQLFEATQKEISHQVMTFFEKSHSVNETIAQSGEYVEELLMKTKETMDRSVESERDILNVCDGMRKMGYAKGNLEAIIQVITHLEQLFSCLEKLEKLLEMNKYDDMMKILQTTQLLLNLFEKWSQSEPTISNAILRYDLFGTKILDHAKDAIDKYEKNICGKDDVILFITIVNCLSEKHIKEFVQWLYNHLLVGYSNEFPMLGENSGLDKIKKRFDWFVTKYNFYKKNYEDILPKKWKVAESLALEFVSATKVSMIMLVEELSEETNKPNGISKIEFTKNVVNALNTSIKFEKAVYKLLYKKEWKKKIITDTPQKQPMSRLTSSSSSRSLQVSQVSKNPFDDSNETNEIESTNPFDDIQSNQQLKQSQNQMKQSQQNQQTKQNESTNPFDDIIMNEEGKEIDIESTNPFDDEPKQPKKQIMLKSQSQQKIESQFDGMEPTVYSNASNPFQNQNDIEESELPHNKYAEMPFTVGVLSKCFEPYIDGFIEYEKSEIQKYLQENLPKEDFVCGSHGVLTSCHDFLMKCRKSIERVTEITQGQPFIEILQQVIENSVQYISDVLGKCKETNTIQRSCSILNSTDHLRYSLENYIKRKMVEHDLDQSFQSQITFIKIDNCFKQIIDLMIVNLLSKLDTTFVTMTKMKWDVSYEEVDDEDDYVFQIISIINETFGEIKSSLFQNYYLNVCHATVSMITGELFTSIFKCKKISVDGSRKMQMGFGQIKSTLQRLPVLEITPLEQTGVGIGGFTESDYANHVKKSFVSIENVLKVLQIEKKDDALTLYRQLHPNQGDDLFKKIWKKTESAKDNHKILNEVKKLKKIGNK